MAREALLLLVGCTYAHPKVAEFIECHPVAVVAHLDAIAKKTELNLSGVGVVAVLHQLG